MNDEIRAPRIRLIGSDGDQLGVVDLKEAKRVAMEAELDLVEISPNADPPVVQVMNYGKFLYQQQKKKTAAKKRQKQIKVKEIKFRPGTDVNDYEVKLRNLRGFLEQGDKAKVTVWFKGREMTHQDLGLQLLKRVEKDLEEVAKIEFFPKLEGRQLIMILAPKKSK